MSSVDDEVMADLVPGGVLRAAINLGNPVLAQGRAAAPGGVIEGVYVVPADSGLTAPADVDTEGVRIPGQCPKQGEDP